MSDDGEFYRRLAQRNQRKHTLAGRQLEIEAMALSDVEADRLYQQSARDFLTVPYDPTAHLWDKPTDATLCPVCFEWRRYPIGQRHFGWGWWRVCALNCTHAHHADEVWLAAAGGEG
jgi:hypothetical protein